MLEEPEEITSKDLKVSMRAVSHPIERNNEEMEIIKKKEPHRNSAVAKHRHRNQGLARGAQDFGLQQKETGVEARQ